MCKIHTHAPSLTTLKQHTAPSAATASANTTANLCAVAGGPNALLPFTLGAGRNLSWAFEKVALRHNCCGAAVESADFVFAVAAEDANVASKAGQSERGEVYMV